MRNLILAGAAALAFTAAPAMAQNMGQGMEAGAYNMNPTQQKMFMSWEDDQRIAYTRWPIDIQEYYWTLNEDQVRGWWLLTDEQRMRIVGMVPQQRAAAWTAVMNQMAGATPAATRPATTMMPASSAGTVSGDIRWVSNARVQNIPADTAVGDPPICGPNEYDNCINAWEAGKRGPNVTKPLSYWPGKPASEM